MLQSLENLQVLLVEASSMQAKVIEQALHRCGVTNVTLTANCDAALAAMRRQAPSLVISSMYLPDMTGTELLFAMRKDDDLEWLPFILVSSETRPKMLEPVRQAGACGILPKPFSDEQLRRALYATLELLQEDESLSAMGIEVKHLKVLLVDDSRSSRNFIRRILESVGIPECYEANCGTDALMVLENQHVDLIIT
ncbi:MAG: response regulator, partial [Rhodocyclaceae bacterium]